MKKTKKALASLAIASMALTMVPFNAFASGTVPPRLSGTTAAQTAVAIADQTGWTGTAILASSASYGMVDALTAGPLASYLKAPILLTGATSTLDADTKAELTKLNVKTVYVTSGTAVIKQSVLDELKGMNITVVPLGGKDRAETSVNIAAKMPAATKVVIANGLQDALSIAAIASAANAPILLTDKDKLPDSVAGFLAANPGITSSDVIGGTGVISDAVKAKLPGATRHAGMSAYDTNNQVIQDFASSLKFDNVFVANGVTGIDALAGAPLAALSNSAIVLTDGTVPAAAKFVSGKLAAGSVVTALGGAAVVTDAVVAGVKTGVVNPPAGALSVTSVSAISAESFKVVFNQAPADTTKIAFTVKNGSMPVTVSATWNTAKTEATLTSSSKYVSGTYSVAVKNDATELGSSNVTVTEQKVAKIEITSSKLGVTSVTSGTPAVTVQTGYATYRILDQYGVDITNVALANNVTFQTGVGSIDASKGLIKVSPSSGLNLLTFGGGVVITANDTSSGVSTTATLSATSQIGTLSDIKLTTLTNADGKVLTAGNSTDVFYAGYEATDLSGNPTTNYTMIQQGLILTSNFLTSSSPNVTAELIQDPADSSKALIKVVATSAATQIDMPVVITAMTWTGKTSQINTTLKKQSEVDSFTLYAPSVAIASGEEKLIPFSAVDQNGVAVTKYSDLFGGSTPLVTLTGAYPVLNNDGTASIKNTAVTNSGTTSVPAVISAVTKTGKYSSITINIQKPVKADTLVLDSSVLMSNLQETSGGVYATQKADFGWDEGGFAVKDQYGRVIDMTTAAASNYRVKVTPVTPAIIDATVTGGIGGELSTGASQVVITAKATGTATVKFELYDVTAPTVIIDTKSQSFTAVKDSDIKDYTITQLDKPIYIINGINSLSGMTVTDQEAGFKANPKVYGTTASGAKVVLRGTPVIGANSTSADFLIFNGATGGAFDSIKVVANALSDPAKTESNAYIIVTVMGADGFVHTVKTPIKSSTAKPSAASVDVAVATEVVGIERDVDTVTLTTSGAITYSSLLGTTLAKFDSAGAAGTQNVYFAPLDQYGTTAANMAQYVVIASGTSRANGSTIAIASNGAISGTMEKGDYITVSASTTTGLVKTIKIEFK
ncbi:N-acetylmuramoyl-L-alanine amidase [Desulfosporosinus sp. I2]|uniref:cell wall-binding repeat-containing protein n=1 Tax=Desulfosporosinus sp. I2 TaxID=1617025 RepID=UPI0005ED6773|nr:cell wall-binding repeat-containing protein [Desulfosporosinus sp. I2]KJR47063.1 N-acetylmuramoyl-L-alanine amidase [Desulfosporosinus sp. I2]